MLGVIAYLFCDLRSNIKKVDRAFVAVREAKDLAGIAAAETLLKKALTDGTNKLYRLSKITMLDNAHMEFQIKCGEYKTQICSYKKPS